MKKRSGSIEKNIESLIETVSFIKDNMVTKDDIADMATKDDLASVDQRLGQRIGSISNRLDQELDKRKQIEVRVSRLERTR